MKSRIRFIAVASLAALALIGATGVLAEARKFTGNKKSNKVVGTKKADNIRLGAGNDRASGRGGKDKIAGAAGKDRLKGDGAADRINGGKGNDTLSGGKGNDRVNGAAGKDRINGGAGKDRLNGSSGNDRVNGSTGNDRINGSTGNDRVNGSSGNDRVTGGKGKDRIAGGTGNDFLNAADGRRDVSVNAGSGRNTCRIDQADLAVAKGCGTINVAPPPGSGPGGPGGGPGAIGDPGEPGQPGAAGDVTLVQGTGLACDMDAPSCDFSLTINPGELPLGDLLTQLGVQLNGEGSLVQLNPTVQVGENVLVAGAYACTDDAVLRVTVNDQVIEVPVACERPE